MGIRERKAREKRAKRRVILEAAKAVFFEKGFASATMDQIAESAEVSKGSLYLHFSGKEELYVSILIEGLEMLYDQFREAVENTPGWEDRLRRIGRAYYGFYLDNKPYFKILFLLHHGELAPHVPDPLFKMCHEKGLACLGFLSDAIGQGIREGMIRAHDPMDLALLVWGSFNGIILLYEEEEHRKFFQSPLDKVVEISIDFLLGGLKRSS